MIDAFGVVDDFLNRITMYRLVLYVLCIFLAAGLFFSGFGMLPFSALSLLYSSAVLIGACWIFNYGFARFFGAHTNFESAYITGLILALILRPVAIGNTTGLGFLLFAAVFAMGSKYILAIGKKHIFNPAALAAAGTAFLLGQYASWWIGGNLLLLPFVLIGGLLIVRKIQRFDLLLATVAAALVGIAATSPGNILTNIENTFIHTPLIFFATIMVTEPLTTPPTRMLRLFYGAITGFLFAPAIHVGPIYATPEIALLVGNVFSFTVSPKYRAVLTLKEKHEVGAGIWEFSFETPQPLSFAPGQYLEWTLAHPHSDSRGNRRYFTIASSPTEKDVRLGVRRAMLPERSSSFKERLFALEWGDRIVSGSLAGDFTMPADTKEKLVFIAGGIGVTPFRSMAKYLSDTGEHRDVVLLYSSKTENEIAYRDIFEEAAKIGLRTLYAITNEGAKTASDNTRYQFIDADLIQKEIPDFAERTFYLSGPRGMIIAFEETLRGLGIPRTHIKTDFFPGFA